MYRKIVCAELYIITAISIANTSKYYMLINSELENIHHMNVRKRLVDIAVKNPRGNIDIATISSGSTTDCMKMYYKYRVRSCIDGIVEQLYTWHQNDNYRADSLDGIPEYEYMVDALATRLISLKN